MNTSAWIKLIFVALLAFFGAGGACYELPEPVSSKNMVAADVFTSYFVNETSGGYVGKCSRKVFGQFWGGNQVFQMEAPAEATYNGEKIAVRPTDNHSKYFDSDCADERAEFVLIDWRGGKKTDVYETRKVRFTFPAEIVRDQDLRVPVEFDDKYDYEFEGWLESKNADAKAVAKLKVLSPKDEAELAERLNNPDIPKNISYFLRNEKLLVIPATVLSPLVSGDLTATISVKQRFFKLKSSDPKNSVKSTSFLYEYNLEQPLKLK